MKLIILVLVIYLTSFLVSSSFQGIHFDAPFDKAFREIKRRQLLPWSRDPNLKEQAFNTRFSGVPEYNLRSGRLPPSSQNFTFSHAFKSMDFQPGSY